MHFKNPEILYFLFLLIIPILVHLFQLNKFKKVAFTNVAFLKKIQLQTRKSSQLKKWLILTTRMLLFTAIILAFSQPYLSNKNADKKQQNFIYLDNSFSTNTKGKKGDLLKITTQQIIENTTEKDGFSLLTNDDYFENISTLELQNKLLSVENSGKSTNFKNVLLRFNNSKSPKINTLSNYILISDFQKLNKNNIKEFTNVTKEEGTRFFYQQMITGDTSDNILGIRGLGKVKASKLLKDTARKDWDNMIIDLYIKEFGYEEGRNRCVQNSQLLWILQRDKQMPMDFSYEQIQK